MKDSLDVFLNEASRIPLLTADEEIHLGRRVQAMIRLQEAKPAPYTKQEQRIIKRGMAARNRVISANIKLVASICRKRQRGLGGFNAAPEDMMQDGILGLIRAVEKWDPERGYKFSTYAYWWICQMITRGIEQNGRTIRLPHQVAERFMAHNRIMTQLTAELGRPPTKAEMAKAMKLTVDEYERALLIGGPCASLEANVTEDGSELGTLLGDGATATDHLEQVSDSIDVELIKQALKMLTPKQQMIIKMRYGIGGTEPQTWAQIGRKLNVSREAIRLQADRAYRQIQRHMLLTKQVEQPTPDPWGLLAV